MNGFDVSITGKVFLVECQNPFDAVDPHCGQQSRIVNLSARNIVNNEQPAPFLVHGQTIRKQSQSFFKRLGPAVGFRGSQPYPLRSSRRVQVFQNSATFCGV